MTANEPRPNRNLIRAALDTLPVNVAILDASGTIVWTNRSWGAFSEAGSGDAERTSIGVNYLDAAADSDEFGDRAIDGLDALLTGEHEEFSMEYPCHTPDREQWYLMWAAPFDVDGQRYVSVAHFDVTDRALAEQAVADRTAEVRRQRDHLALLNQIVRHDIRNDIQLVLTHAELLEDAVPEDERDHVDRVLQQASHVIELTEAVGDLEEVITDDSEPTLTPVNLGAVLRVEVDKLRSGYQTAHTSVTVSGTEELPFETEVLANEMLSSVFGNLLTNAVVHNTSDEPRIDISIERRTDAVVVTVADDGPGIPEADWQSAFGHGEMGLDSPGTGIGLYLVDSLTDLYGGDVWITDSDFGGTAVHVELQLAD